MNRLTMNRLTMNRLTAAALSSAGISAAVSDLIVDAPGRELLTYIARCALPSGKSLTVTQDFTTYTFEGSIGLAPNWLDKPLTNPTTQRWVSACLLAHVNGYGVEVPISLRGSHPALYTTWDEMVEYSVQETAFFGNVFAVDDDGEENDEEDEGDDELNTPKSPGSEFYSCGGYTLRTQCGGDEHTYRPQRSCGTNESCALRFSGTCKDLTVKAGNACKTATFEGYNDCHVDLSDSKGRFPSGSEHFKEVVTVYLRPREFNELYVGCAPLP